MTERVGICTNVGGCVKADALERQRVPLGAPFQCTACGRELNEVGGGSTRRGGGGLPLLLGGAAATLVLLILAGLGVRSCVRQRSGDGSGASTAGSGSKLPWSTTYDLVLAGSNTIGGVDSGSQRGLARDLVNGFLLDKWPGGAVVDEKLEDVGKDEKERIITYRLSTGDLRRVRIKPHGSKTSIDALKSADADRQAVVGMSSSPRPELQEGFNEYVVALDAVAVIAHPDNPVSELTLEQLRQIFGPNPPPSGWKTYGRDIKSGTTECFRLITGIEKDLKAAGMAKDAVLPFSGVPAGEAGHEGFEDTSKIAEKVSRDPNGIGFVGRAAELPTNVKAVAIRPAAGYSAFSPNSITIRTMEYALARELFLYTKANPAPLASDFIRFALSDAGQKIADQAGFIGFTPDNLLGPPVLGDRAPEALRQAVAGHDRVVMSLRFRHGASDALDTLSAQNFKVLTRFLSRPELAQRELTIVGCVDSTGSAAINYVKSRERANTIAEQLRRTGVTNRIRGVYSFGEDYLIYDDGGNADSLEAARNRRVDLYLKR